MKLSSTIALRPVVAFVVLGVLVLIIPISAILSYQTMAALIEDNVKLVCNYMLKQVFSQVQTIAGSLVPINSSAMNLARSLRSSVNGQTQLPFSKISTLVAPKLFLAFSMLPLSQISYMQTDGLFFSYYIDKNQTLTVYTNTSFVKETANTSTSYNWYTQQVDNNTGKPYGEVIVSKPRIFFTNSSWFQEAVNTSNGYSFVGTGWGESAESLFLSIASINNGGVVSLGLSVKDFANAIHGVDTLKGTLFLATDNGSLLARSGTLNASMKINNGSVSLEVMKNEGDLTGKTFNISCGPSDNIFSPHDYNIAGEKHTFYCAPLEIAGIHSVFVLVSPKNGLLGLIQKNNQLSFWLLALSVVSVFLSTVLFIFLIFRGARREMILCSTLIKQMEATQQAERKSMNKSIAFASANHDIRGSIAAILGLIDFCLSEVPHRSTMGINLSQMKTSSMDLLELLNSVLDASKIEAGKMQLYEEDFDLAQVIEDAVNFIYPKAVEKRIDVVLDPCDSSVFRSRIVKGDRGKLKQILNNLLSNAVKFTSEGHVVLRAWVKKPSPSLETSILASKNNIGVCKCITQLLYKDNEEDYSNTLHTVQQNENSLELVFEVDDTGNGIPKENRNSVFENFVQVKETALGQGGTGLGLGIVQSLVRLMGGEISIVDKEIGEKGTCFHFNIFLSKCENSTSISVREDSSVYGGLILNDQLPQSPGLNSRTQSPRLEGSQVILMIQGDERRKVVQNFIRQKGINVSALNQWEHLLPILERIKRRLYINHLSSSEKSEFGLHADHLSNSPSNNSNAGTKDGHSSNFNEGVDHISPHHRRTSSSSFILIIIDDCVEPMAEVCSIVSTFKKKHHDSRCKVVGLVSPFNPPDETGRASRNILIASCDHVLIKPFHGSRLYQVIKLLPEYGGTFIGTSSKSMDQDAEPFTDELYSKDQLTNTRFQTEISSPRQYSPRFQPVENEGSNHSIGKPLNGKKILVVEDVPLLRKIAIGILSRLGATIESCENGEEAVKQVFKSLQETDQRIQGGTSKFPPYDYIFMDCEMPIMNGYEAARQIQTEEQLYDVHMPIIALTAHASSEEAEKIRQAGMDFHLTKPLQVEELLNAIRLVDGKEN